MTLSYSSITHFHVTPLRKQLQLNSTDGVESIKQLFIVFLKAQLFGVSNTCSVIM